MVFFWRWREILKDSNQSNQFAIKTAVLQLPHQQNSILPEKIHFPIWVRANTSYNFLKYIQFIMFMDIKGINKLRYSMEILLPIYSLIDFWEEDQRKSIITTPNRKLFKLNMIERFLKDINLSNKFFLNKF